jgi:hypothetical protein
MELNSEEFYKQKYLKYKHKYLEAQRLYGEELEGGGALRWLIVPKDIYNTIIKPIAQQKKYSKDSVLYFLSGKSAYVIDKEGKSVYASYDNKKVETPAIIGNGLGVVNKKYSDSNATAQLKEAYPDMVYILIESNRFSSGGLIKSVDEN